MWEWAVSMLWFVMWGAAVVDFQAGSVARKADVAFLEQPLTGLQPGDAPRVEGRLAPAPDVVTPEDAAQTAATLSGSAWGYYVQETVLEPGAAVFIIGQLESADPTTGVLRIAPDPKLGLYLGTQADLVDVLGSASRGLFWASFAFLGLALTAIPPLRLRLGVSTTETAT